MKAVLTLAAIPLILSAGDRKPLPGQAGNDNVELTASIVVDRDEIKDLLGADIGEGYVVAKVTVTPKTDDPLSVSLDDFTIISGKDGQRSVALDPGQIAGHGGLIVKRAANQPGGEGTATNGPIWGGVGPIGVGRRAAGNTSNDSSSVEAVKTDPGKKEQDSPLLTALKAKVLPAKDSTDPVSGLLYFPIDGKIKPKDLRIVYANNKAGKLVIEFENPSKKKK